MALLLLKPKKYDILSCDVGIKLNNIYIYLYLSMWKTLNIYEYHKV